MKSTKRYLIFDDSMLALTESKDVFIGRDMKSCDISFFDERVSRKHARIFCREGNYYIQDLDSLNGVIVNNKRIQGAAELVEGDMITLRPHELRFVGEAEVYRDFKSPASETQREDALPVDLLTEREKIEERVQKRAAQASTIAMRQERRPMIRVKPRTLKERY